nr:metallophosphoesterase [candidate division Zixibacteria bacterium]
MRLFWLSLFSISVLAFFAIVDLIILKYLNKSWWNNRLIRRAIIIMPFWGIIGVAIWSGGRLTDLLLWTGIGSTLAITMLVFLMGLAVTLPLSGIINSLLLRMEGRSRKKTATKLVDSNRRRVLKGLAAALPLAGMSAGGSGVIHAYGKTEIPRIAMKFKNLPPQMEGFKILHLSDSHLGIYKNLDDLEEILVKAEKYSPDLLLYTGDIADDLTILSDVLKLVDGLKTRFGKYASLGNHEYYRGIRDVIEIFDHSPIPLLRSSGVGINIDGATAYISGADDPRYMGKDNRDFLYQTIEEAVSGAPSDSFKILMSHRPEGFDPAADLKIDLTLSGHTHGGQVGYAGQSFWTSFMPERYLWGKYTREGGQMYLTSGIGHWFPFRLGCPTEAPLIVLTSDK